MKILPSREEANGAICEVVNARTHEMLDFFGGSSSAIRHCMARGDELRGRAKRFGIRALKFVKTLPQDHATRAVARQLAKSAPSVSANYHSAGRSRSSAEFRARLGIVVDEADETVGWLEMLKESGSAAGPELDWLLNESRELRAIFVQAVKTARLNEQRSREEGR